MEQKSTSLWKSAITYGIYIGIASILVSVIYYATGNTFAKSEQWVAIAVMIIAIILVQLDYRKMLGGYMTYTQALIIAVLAMLFASVLSGIYNFVLMNYIDPSLQEQARIMAEQKLIARGIPEEQLEPALNIAMKFQKPIIMFIMGLVMGPLMGLIIGLITSIFTKKVSPEAVE